MGRRSMLLLAAMLVAALGTGSVLLYVRGVDDRALRNQDPVQVLVAKSVIHAGTPVSTAQSNGAFVLKTVPRSAVAQGALSSLTGMSDKVAAADIFPNEQILPGKLTSAGAVGSLPIPAGKLAMSVQLGDPQRVAGFVAPGSEVAVFATVTPPATTGGAGAVEITNLLLARVPVIAVGPTTVRAGDDRNKEALPTAILTLAVSQREAAKLVQATQTGQLYFALLTKDSKVGPAPAVDSRNLFN